MITPEANSQSPAVTHQYIFPDRTRVDVWLTLLEHHNLDPKAIRARLVYGPISHAALPGQQTRGGLLVHVAIAVPALTAVGLW